MKKIKELLFTSIMSMSFLLVSFESRASENLEVVMIENSNIMRLEVKNPSLEEIDLYLYNQNDRKIFSEKVGLGETFVTQIDFSGLKNGTYTLVSEVSNMRVNRVIEISGSQIDLVDNYYTFIPVFTQKDDKLLVHYINNGGEDIGVSIESNDGAFFDAFYKNGDTIFSKAFSLENLGTGTYKFQFISQSDFYTHEFEVD